MYILYLRNSIPVCGNGGKAIKEDDNAKERDREEPGRVESNPSKIDANFFTKIPPVGQI